MKKKHWSKNAKIPKWIRTLFILSLVAIFGFPETPGQIILIGFAVFIFFVVPLLTPLMGFVIFYLYAVTPFVATLEPIFIIKSVVASIFSLTYSIYFLVALIKAYKNRDKPQDHDEEE